MQTLNSWFQPNAIAVVGALTIAAVPSLSVPALAAGFFYQQTNLVSDIPGLAANTDSNLENPWGVSFSSTSPFWVSNNGTRTSTLYNGSGVKQALVVTIPGAGNVTGQVFNSSADAFNDDLFLFASEDGTISGWRAALGTMAETLVIADPPSVYKGLAIGKISSDTFLYGADFKAGTIDIYNANAAPTTLPNDFTDPNLPAGYAPFNIQQLGGSLFVTYALQDGTQTGDVPGVGNGFVNEFDVNGNLIKRLISNGLLNSPWGITLAPATFGDFGNALLVGNFGDGLINAYDRNNGNFLGQLKDASGNAIAIEGLRALTFGNGGNAGKTSELFFTAGINGEANGLFGKLEAKSIPETVPEPNTISLLSLCFTPFLYVLCRRKN